MRPMLSRTRSNSRKKCWMAFPSPVMAPSSRQNKNLVLPRSGAQGSDEPWLRERTSDPTIMTKIEVEFQELDADTALLRALSHDLVC